MDEFSDVMENGVVIGLHGELGGLIGRGLLAQQVIEGNVAWRLHGNSLVFVHVGLSYLFVSYYLIDYNLKILFISLSFTTLNKK